MATPRRLAKPLALLLALLPTAAMADPAAPTNVDGGPLAICCRAPATGAARDGLCRAMAGDPGVHTVCAVVTAEFLAFTATRGNDLQTPRPEFNFPGLKPGDRWCLCAGRWREALAHGVAPPVVLAATDRRTLDYVDLAALRAHADGG